MLIDGKPACARCGRRPRRPKPPRPGKKPAYYSYCSQCHTDYCAERRAGMVEVLLTPAEWHQVKQARLQAAAESLEKVCHNCRVGQHCGWCPCCMMPGPGPVPPPGREHEAAPVKGDANRRRMLERLEQYAGLRGAGMLPADAGREIGVSTVVTGRYERWYRRERLHLPDRPAGMPRSGMR